MRAEELSRCMECLAPFKADATKCSNCNAGGTCWWRPFQSYYKKSQTGKNGNIVQKCKKELQESKTIIKDLKNKILELEKELKRANTAHSEVGRKWTDTLREKNQELGKVNKLDSLCKSGEIELKKLQEQIGQKDMEQEKLQEQIGQKDMKLEKLQEQISHKDMELEKHRERWAQPSQAAPAAVQQQYSASIQQHAPAATQQHCPASIQQHCSAQIQQHCPVSTQQHCPASASNNLGHYNTPNLIKPTLMDLHDQQQKIWIMAPNMSWLSYSSYNPNMGPYDTGQYCR